MSALWGGTVDIDSLPEGGLSSALLPADNLS